MTLLSCVSTIIASRRHSVSHITQYPLTRRMLRLPPPPQNERSCSHILTRKNRDRQKELACVRIVLALVRWLLSRMFIERM